MDWARASAIGWLFNGRRGSSERLIPRWLFLRALGLIYFSAFFSLIFQVRGLVGLAGILPAGSYLQAVAQSLGHWQRLWYAPTVLWVSSGPEMLSGLCWLGMIASVLLALNLWPRGMLVVCFVCFLSFVSAAQDFSGYQSDGMLLEAGFISFFFAPAGFRPRLGPMHPASRASLFLLQWECFRVYFESGAVKLLSGDPEWQPYGLADARHEWPGCDDWDSQRVSRSANHSPDHLYLNWLPRVHMAELRVSEQHALAGRWLDEPTQVKAFFGQLEALRPSGN